MSRIAAKFVPRLLTDEQKQIWVDMIQELFNWANEDENFLKNVITGDEAWVYGYDVETKAQIIGIGVKRVSMTEKSETSVVKH
jgi:predicted AAA+ superfamily ATPase